MEKQASQVHSQVREWREKRGIRPSELAGAIGITRQALHSIEAGNYAPNTVIALQLAQYFGCTVEDLFALAGVQVQATSLGAVHTGTRVKLAQVAGKWLAFPVTGQSGLNEQADGWVTAPEHRQAPVGQTTVGQATVELFNNLLLARHTAVLAGCDPAFALLASHIARQPNARILLRTLSSKAALRALVRGEAHAAGIHLYDPVTGVSNLPFVQEMFPSQQIHLFTLWAWEQGLQVAPGNPKAIIRVTDLLRPEVKLQNRQPDAGSRMLLEYWLDKAAIGPEARREIAGYSDEVCTPLEAAQRVASGMADVAPGPRSAAAALGLDFVPLQVERFDLVVPAAFVGHPGIQAILAAVQEKSFRYELQALGGYDPSHAGELWKVTA